MLLLRERVRIYSTLQRQLRNPPVPSFLVGSLCGSAPAVGLDHSPVLPALDRLGPKQPLHATQLYVKLTRAAGLHHGDVLAYVHARARAHGAHGAASPPPAAAACMATTATLTSLGGHRGAGHRAASLRDPSGKGSPLGSTAQPQTSGWAPRAAGSRMGSC
eukprot:scaffold6243_cov70-Phaeocystis_antarctica.AAC.2